MFVASSPPWSSSVLYHSHCCWQPDALPKKFMRKNLCPNVENFKKRSFSQSRKWTRKPHNTSNKEVLFFPLNFFRRVFIQCSSQSLFSFSCFPPRLEDFAWQRRILVGKHQWDGTAITVSERNLVFFLQRTLR